MFKLYNVCKTFNIQWPLTLFQHECKNVGTTHSWVIPVGIFRFSSCHSHVCIECKKYSGFNPKDEIIQRLIQSFTVVPEKHISSSLYNQ